MSLGGSTGTFYSMGAGFADYLNRNATLFKTTPNTSGGGLENLRRLGKNEAELGIVYAVDLDQAWNAQGQFEKEQIRNVRIIGLAQRPTAAHGIVLEKSGITKVEDLVGKKVVPGAPGASVTFRVELFLKAAGIYDKVKIQYMGNEETAQALKDGVIDCFFRAGSYPWTGISEIEVTHKVRVLDLGPMMDKSNFIKNNPGFIELTIPANTYPRQTEPIRSFGEPLFWGTRADIPAEVIYEFCKIGYSPEACSFLDTVYKAHAHRDPLNVLPVPMHPGAEKYWTEKGVKLPTPSNK
jgi:TRAP transporter TAXI family solute receptor